MKKMIIVLLALICSCTTVLYGQNERNRTVPTIVQDALAQLPAENKTDFNREMLDLVSCSDRSLVEIAGMFQKEGEKINSKLEYAVGGMVSYVTENPDPAFLEGMRKGFAAVLEGDYAVNVKRLFIYQLRFFSSAEDLPVLLPFLEDKDLSSIALQTITATPEAGDAVLGLIKEGKSERKSLAVAAGQLELAEAEPYIMEAYRASEGKERGIYSAALAQCGTEASLKLLSKGKMTDYLALLEHLEKEGKGDLVFKKAKALLSSRESEVRTAALKLVLASGEADAGKYISDALGSEDRRFRAAALESAGQLDDAALWKRLAGSYGKFPQEAQVDLIYALGENRVESAVGLLTKVAGGSGECAAAAIAALGKIGNDETSGALLSLLETEHCTAAADALLYSGGNIVDGLESVISTSPSDPAKIAAMNVASRRGLREVADAVFGLLDAESKAVKTAAYKALEGVVSSTDFVRIAELERAGAAGFENELRAALHSASARNHSADALEEVVAQMEKSSRRYLYYSSLAVHESEEAVRRLADEYRAGENSEAALDELMKMTDPSVLDVLLEIGRGKKSDEILERYVSLVDKAQLPLESKYFRLNALLSGPIDVPVQKKVVLAMGNLNDLSSFRAVVPYLDRPETSYEAALAVKKLGTAICDEIDSAELTPVLEKACTVFAEGKGGDDSYYIAEIKELISAIRTEPVFELSEEEKEMGFEVLFDGTNMDKWEGDQSLYSIVNGAITVSANYEVSAPKNLYTKKEYKDFIFRFEFCFTKPAANNGVGIRTPRNVNAAYHGMCEIQILDHDDPVYKDLMPYQVHGSIYGLYPAKRIVHKPLGEWGTEEIIVKGDCITVTLNGEVVVDNVNVRELVQGHNVAPDGSTRNPYTLDHTNHPGLFNKKGYIGFLGHGPGIKIKNVRILDLSK